VVAPAKLRRVRMILHVELAAIVLILLCAAIMAKGGWI
jgi:putative membrane protein